MDSTTGTTVNESWGEDPRVRNSAGNISEGVENLVDPSSLAPFRPPITLAILLISCYIVAIACASIFLNGCLLVAISKVEDIKLRAKRLIQSASLANIILPAISALDTDFMMSIFGRSGVATYFCLSGLQSVVFTVVIFVQSICSLGLPLDRVYAIARPLDYYTVGYNKWVRGSMVGIPWVVAVLIYLGLSLGTLKSLPPLDGPSPKVCLFLYLSFETVWKTKALDVFLLSANTVSFLTYISIFVSLKLQRRGIERDSETASKRNNLSLAITFFMTNITTICLYLPFPLYSALFLGNPEYTAGDIVTYVTTIRGMALVYLCNCCFDPLILIFRVPSIRQSLPFK